MTTTSNMCGLKEDEKPSSRVLRPPGGASSDIFGTSTAPTSAPRQQNQRNGSNIFGGPEEPSPSRAQANNSSQSNLFGMEPHVLAGKGRNQSKFNPITGEPYEDAVSPAAAPAAPVVKQQQEQQPQPQQPQQTASPSAAASDQSGQGDASLQAGEGKAQPGVHTSSRVLNPPGGVAHKLW
ncbi:jupiter microtubule associated homolog 1-like isoform X2 [Haliotis rufescens]|uniref:jupiter microtubule associated homolog 1-like isoform X2 n=1 Tax=Haliotis rufescens TaxID=6454 RepID=UPI00201FABD5|nr:jupiter microtubule associated homolog 1-like isoform X2 [Haliotis rufescens]